MGDRSAGLLQPELPNQPGVYGTRGSRVAVQHVGIEVDAGAPAHRARLAVHRGCGELDVVVDAGEEAAQLALEVEFPHQSIGEHHAKYSTAEVLHIGHAGERCHDVTLPEGLDGREDSATIDWNLKESVRAAMRARVRRLLAQYDYPPDKEERAIDLVIEQAELFAHEAA